MGYRWNQEELKTKTESGDKLKFDYKKKRRAFYGKYFMLVIVEIGLSQNNNISYARSVDPQRRPMGPSYQTLIVI